MAEILVIEDDPVFGELLVMHLQDRGHQPILVRTIDKAREHIRAGLPDAILLDQQLPDGFGIELLGEIVDWPDAPPVIMITGASANDLAIEAMRIGAYDFIRKPMEHVDIDTTLDKALCEHRLSRQVVVASEPAQEDVDLGQIVGSSPAVLAICKTIGAVASRSAPVLIAGETGTGKEVIARAIHHHSGRSGLFLPINCSALAEGVLESELFGHEAGSFTGAVGRRQGRFELAAGGTLFLDELGEMPVALQGKLLRVLQEGTYERVGGNQTLRSDARIIAATNRDLGGLVSNGMFREDLYYRMNVVAIDIPPLRDRMSDLPVLVEHLLRRVNARQHSAVTRIAAEAWRKLQRYDWPGNVRELENVLTRAAVFARTGILTPDLLELTESGEAGGIDSSRMKGQGTARSLSLIEIEEEHIRSILSLVRWHKGKACEILGISRPALERKIEKYGIS